MKYPTRNSGLCQKSKQSNILPSLKVKAGIKLPTISLYAFSLVLLAGDVSRNPGPINTSQHSQKSYNITFPSNHGLKIAHLNVRSLVNKIDSLRILLKNNPFNVLTISKTWLTNKISDPELTIQGYSFARNDHKNKKGGGCMIYICDGLPYHTRPDLQENNIETCVLEVNRPKCKNLFIWSIYRAPDHRIRN